ncbi:MAG TPA: glyoxalase superfamily protein [Candidatus Aquilonibacter sp.]|nr:glyoxalase superfamily protein [Candidatus Aquilonibacter sp.]
MSASIARMINATPILRVNDLQASVAYYTGILGFKLDWQTGGFGSVSRDRCTLFLCEGGQGHAGTWTWTGVSDVELLYTELQGSGAKILQGPTNYPWGSREMHVVDLDGHVLRFASEATDEPFGQFPSDRTDA